VIIEICEISKSLTGGGIAYLDLGIVFNGRFARFGWNYDLKNTIGILLHRM
jgi:hypothetical protein